MSKQLSLFLTSNVNDSEDADTRVHVTNPNSNLSVVIPDNIAYPITLNQSHVLNLAYSFQTDPFFQNLIPGDVIHLGHSFTYNGTTTIITDLITQVKSIQHGVNTRMEKFIKSVTLADGVDVKPYYLWNASPRAFQHQPGGYLHHKLPYSMNIKCVTLDAVMIHNMEVNEYLMPGKHVTGKECEHHDYYIVDIPELQHAHGIASNSTKVGGHFAVISTHEVGNSGSVEGASMHVHTRDMHVRHEYSSTRYVNQLRVRLLTPKGEPAVCHRAHFQLHIKYDDS